MRRIDARRSARHERRVRWRARGRALSPALFGLSCVTLVQPSLAATWRYSASATLSETYTSNANYSPTAFAQGDWVTTVSGSFGFNADGARLKLHGNVGAAANVYATQTQNNSIAPTVSLGGTLEAIEKFAFLDAQASVSQTFQSPFGPQPASLVNATPNRYTQQVYSLSPYIKGVFGSTEIGYQIRDDNYWTFASDYGNSTTSVPSTYTNVLAFTMNGPARPISWDLSYTRSYYDNGFSGDQASGQGTYTIAIARAYYPYKYDPQLEITPRVGYERDEFPPVLATDTLQTNSRNESNTIYGVGVKWSPTERTLVDGFWEHRFFGSSYSWQVNHRLPNASLNGSFFRGISSYPQLALTIPAGANVAQFIDAAFTTRFPDPIARQQAVQQFLAQSGLPPTLFTPVSYYNSSLTLQTSGTFSIALIGVLNSLQLTTFYSKTEAITTSGAGLPPLLAASQDNTQKGVGASYGYRLSGTTNASANATYSTTTTNAGPLVGAKSDNASASISINTTFGPKTSGSAGILYSWSNAVSTPGTGNTSTLNLYVTVSHTF